MGRAFVHNVELVRKICRDITEARDDRDKE